MFRAIQQSHRYPDLSNCDEICYRMKVIDVIEPYAKGEKLVCSCACVVNRIIQELITYCKAYKCFSVCSLVERTREGMIDA